MGAADGQFMQAPDSLRRGGEKAAPTKARGVESWQPEEEECTHVGLKRRAASRQLGRRASAVAATAAESGGGDRNEKAEAELLNMVCWRNGPEPRLKGRVRFARAGEPARERHLSAELKSSAQSHKSHNNHKNQCCNWSTASRGPGIYLPVCEVVRH